MSTEKIKYTFPLLLALMLLVVPILSGQDTTYRGYKVRFQSEIMSFMSVDSVKPPPKHSILFIGSSIFRKWKSLKEDMSPLPVFNRAFGGSRTHEVLYYMDKIVFPYEPKIIVYYCGSNDAGGSVPAATVVKNITDFFNAVSHQLPETKLFFVSVNRSPARKAKWSGMDSINTMIRDFCLYSPQRRYIDVNVALFDSAGNPRTELYLDDKLHFKDESYKEFTRIIKPILDKEWSVDGNKQ